MPLTNQPILPQLRLATKPAHMQLEAHPLTASLTTTALTVAKYTYVLWAFQRFYEQMEAVGSINLPYQPLPRLPAITVDLAALQVADNPLPAAPPLLDITTEDQRWGLLYVVEGSRLGGRIIARNVAAVLGLTATTGSAFFTGPATNKQQATSQDNTPDATLDNNPDNNLGWRTFTQLLEASVISPKECIDGANTTFKYIFNWFSAAWGVYLEHHASH